MTTHQEIHNMIESFYVAGETAFTAADILHALNDRIENLNRAYEKHLDELVHVEKLP